MERHEGRSEVVQTDLGRMVRNVARFRIGCFLATLVIAGLLLVGFVCLGLVALFAIGGTSPLLAPGTPMPTPTGPPLPARPPGGVAPAHVADLGGSLVGWRAGAVPRGPQPGPSRGEGKIKGRAHARQFPRRDWARRGHRRPRRGAGGWAQAGAIASAGAGTAGAPAVAAVGRWRRGR